MSKSILFYVFVIGILIIPAYGSDHWDFDGDIGQGWHFEGTPQWHLDCNVNHSGSCSMRSGEILPFSGPTSIWREVQGPVIMSFWWKADSIQVCTDPSVMCKGLFFLVDGKTQLTCDSADWKETRFPLADGLHRVEWIFKPRSDQKGIGWLDNVSIAPSPITTYTKHNLNFKIPNDWGISNEKQINSTQMDGTSINDTQITLTSGPSVIRVDVIEIPQIKWLLNMYDDGPWYVTGVLESFYRKSILKLSNPKKMGGGSGIPVNPDGTKDMSFRTSSNGNTTEWIIAWIKPEYSDKFIAVHALFQGDQQTKSLSMSEGGQSYYMQKPLYEILTSFVTQFGNSSEIRSA
jgi:hypothetical protein